MMMNELVDIMNQLQEVFEASGCKGLDLPQVAVIGTQSSGKSSVLEHLVGRSFLPRGSGVVTRCPLILQMVPADEEYAIFQHDKTRVFTDFSLISKEIEDRTSKLAGTNKGICTTPITLRIFSSCVLNLTLIDLPGLTKVPVGDQPSDVDKQTRSLTLEYIRNPNCIILAITPANADMATSESLQLAKEVDPTGSRTLAVVTKLDLMDEGTDARDMLNGKVIPVRLGIVGVVNRSQKDINQGKSVKDSLKDEAAFFYTKYKNIAANHGSPHLTKTVQNILLARIKNCLPQLRERINQQLVSRRIELSKLKDSGQLDKPTLLLDLITKFSNTYRAAIRGNLSNIQTNELYGGARLNYVFQESLAVTLRSIDALAGLTKSAILTAIHNASGASPALFVSEVAFELLVKRQIERLRNPCLQCVHFIQEELIKIVSSCLDDVDVGMKRYPKLQHEISELVIDLIQGRIPITNQMVHHTIDVHLAYINTAHPDFLPNTPQGLLLTTSSEVAIGPVNSRTLSARTSEENLLAQRGGQNFIDCLLIERLIKSYFSIVRKTTQDSVPKVIMHFLVNYVVEHLQAELVARLYKTDAQDLLQEPPEIAEQRAKATTDLAALEKALHVLDSLSSAGRTNQPRRKLS